MPANPQIYYDRNNYRLHSLKVREEPVSIHLKVPAKDDPYERWLITAVMFRLVVFQDIVQEFTDPASFRLPPAFPLPSAAGTEAAGLSLVSLSSLLASDGKYAKYAAAGMGEWRLEGQRLAAGEGAMYYQIITRLSVRSNIAWDSAAFRKTRLPSPRG